MMKNKDIDVSKIVDFFNETMSYGPISFDVNLGPIGPYDPDDDSPEAHALMKMTILAQLLK